MSEMLSRILEGYNSFFIAVVSVLQTRMESSRGGQNGIQLLLAAEQEAQRIVNVARTGNCFYLLWASTYLLTWIFVSLTTLSVMSLLRCPYICPVVVCMLIVFGCFHIFLTQISICQLCLHFWVIIELQLAKLSTKSLYFGIFLCTDQTKMKCSILVSFISFV